MRWKLSVLVIAAMLLLAFTGMASATDECVDVKCTWEPCGEKVDQGEIDAVYALIPANEMRIMYTDVNSNNRFDDGDALYIDAIPDFDEVEVGDVRLTDYCGTYSPNTKVAHGDNDVGLRTKELPSAQDVAGFVDINNDEVYDKGDWLYIDTDASSTVTVNDVRLYVDGYLPYSRVTSFGTDQGLDLRDLLTYSTDLDNPIYNFLGYIDSDCSSDWSCVDKLYLQQPFNLTVSGAGSIADEFVTIGDFRLYIPQAAIQYENWPECGTKVCQSDIDAVYTLITDSRMRIMYADTNSNDVFDGEEGLYIDCVVEDIDQGVNEEYEVEVGDVRLVHTCGTYDPNTKVAHGDKDLNDRLKVLPIGPVNGDLFVVGFTDVENNGVYDLCDSLYVDTDGDGYVSVRDVRLTPVNGYAAYSRVTSDAGDLGGQLLDIVTGQPDITTSIGQMLGYIDSDCSGTWTCPDKLYLQQLITDEFDGFSIKDDVVSIGDLRLYIPPEAIAEEEWPSCGTKVEQCDIDAVYALTFDTDMRIMYADVNSNNRFDNGDSLYIDTVNDSTFAPIYEVEVGDVRLTDYCGTYEPNTKVDHGDNDQGLTLKELPYAVNPQAVVGYVDVENDWVYDLADWLYVDTDADGAVSVNDVRLTEVDGFPAYSRVAIGDWDIGYALQDVIFNVQIATPISILLGYIDSDCSGDWTCPDKLYLQQYIAIDDEVIILETAVKANNNGPFAHNYFVTIGDLRLYIPPEEINNDNGGTASEVFDVMNYDADGSGAIDKPEVFGAIQDYFADEITKDQVFDVIMVYFS